MANEQTKWLHPVSKSQITRFDCIKKQCINKSRLLIIELSIITITYIKVILTMAKILLAGRTAIIIQSFQFFSVSFWFV
jgi:hypothetical protein